MEKVKGKGTRKDPAKDHQHGPKGEEEEEEEKPPKPGIFDWQFLATR